MRKNNMKISVLTAVIALLFLSFACAGGKPGAAGRHHVEGEKQDNGPGRLPHYREQAGNAGNRHIAAMDLPDSR